MDSGSAFIRNEGKKTKRGKRKILSESRRAYALQR
jgi:hypothetical protein